jgi:hypothetical protein
LIPPNRNVWRDFFAPLLHKAAEMLRSQFATGCFLLIAVLGCDLQDRSGNDAAEAAPNGTLASTHAEVTPEKSSHPETLDQGTGMLRHAVFFSFKESSSDEDVQGVVDEFAALPDKIDSIIDFQYGVNNSPEGKDDGFTHCFLLTFADEAGRAEYLPHPAHKAFGDVLRPHMKSVFVVDYWGDPKQKMPEKALQHAVFFKFKDDAAEPDVKKVEQAFAALPGKIDTIRAFEWGTNNSPETHDAGFTHCFLVTFDSEAGRQTYLPHPDHKAFVDVLLPVLDKVRVLDFWNQGT